MKNRNSAEEMVRHFCLAFSVEKSPIAYRLGYKHGRSFTAKESQQDKMPMGQCFKNALEFCIQFGYLYCEGWATSPELGIPVEHAWAYDEVDDLIIDPTWYYSPDISYFGMVFELREAAAMVVSNRYYGLLCNLFRMKQSMDTTFQTLEAALWKPPVKIGEQQPLI